VVLSHAREPTKNVVARAPEGPGCSQLKIPYIRGHLIGSDVCLPERCTLFTDVTASTDREEMTLEGDDLA
jgi:hypothetical protein